MLFTLPVYYDRAGLNGKQMRGNRQEEPAFHPEVPRVVRPLGAFFEEVGLMGRLSRRMWRRAGFL